MAQITLNSSGVASNGSLLLQSNGTTTAVTIDTSQNLGLGVTPSAWYSSWKALEIGSGTAIWRVSGQDFRMSSNLYNDGSNSIYKANGAAAFYSQGSGVHSWYNAASGTAGNAITFTQAMTLSAAGNLGIGNTSPAYPIDISTGANAAQIAFQSTISNGTNFKIAQGIQSVTNSGMQIYDLTNSAVRLAIDGSGNLLAGDTSTAAGERLRVVGSVGNHVSRFVNTKGSTLLYGPQIAYSAISPNDTGNEFLTCVDSTATRMTVRSNGGIANYSGNNVNLSDRREKTNFTPATSYLDKICAIPVQTFNYIDQNLEEDGGLTLGVVAQDVQAVAPEMVMESNWGTEEEPKMRLSIYQTDLQYALMKCIQEQQALITQLTARITALESA